MYVSLGWHSYHTCEEFHDSSISGFLETTEKNKFNFIKLSISTVFTGSIYLETMLVIEY